MFLFTFTKLRKQIFVALLAVCIGIPLLYLGFIFLRISFFSALFRAGLIGMMYYFMLPALLSWAIFGYGQFFVGGIGVGPNGIGGVIITLIFYVIVAFLISLFGNFKKDSEHTPWKTALSKQYLIKLFLIIALVFAIALLLSGLERLLLFPKQLKDVQERMQDEQIPIKIESAIQQGVENLPVQMLQFQKEPTSVTEEEYDKMLSLYKVEFTGGVSTSVGPAALLLSSFRKQQHKNYPPSVWIKLGILPIPNIDLDDLFVQVSADKVIDINGKDIKNITFGNDGKLIAGAKMLKPMETPAPYFAGYKIVQLMAGTKSKDEIGRIEGTLTIKLPLELEPFTLDLPTIYSQGADEYFTFSINKEMNGKYVQMGLTNFTNNSFTIRYRGIADDLLFPVAYADNGERVRLYHTTTVMAGKIQWNELHYSYSGKIHTLKVFAASRMIERSYPFVLSKNSAPVNEVPLEKKSCDALEKDIKKEIEDANYCDTDSDCAITQFGVCPFGCYNLINKNAEVTTIKSALGIYTSKCKQCAGKCMAPPTPDEILCRSNKCVDKRFYISPTTTQQTIKNKQSCESQGGVWGTFGLLQKEQCNMPTADEGKICTDNAQCESVCVADNKIPAGIPVSGNCFGHTVTLGTCLNNVKNGKTQGTICVD